MKEHVPARQRPRRCPRSLRQSDEQREGEQPGKNDCATPPEKFASPEEVESMRPRDRTGKNDRESHAQLL
eukprot:6792996-Pyramimonas_sp.AAC.1